MRASCNRSRRASSCFFMERAHVLEGLTQTWLIRDIWLEGGCGEKGPGTCVSFCAALGGVPSKRARASHPLALLGNTTFIWHRNNAACHVPKCRGRQGVTCGIPTPR